MKKEISFFTLLFIVVITSGFAFGKTPVTGKILDNEYHEPLIGANIVVEGTTQGTITNVDGSFQLQIDDGEASNITISFVGYSDQTVPVQKTGSNIDLGIPEPSAVFSRRSGVI